MFTLLLNGLIFVEINIFWDRFNAWQTKWENILEILYMLSVYYFLKCSILLI